MAKAPKKAEAVPVEETPVTAGLHRIILEGSGVHGAINGEVFFLPGGSEIEVSDELYHAVKAHIIQER